MSSYYSLNIYKYYDMKKEKIFGTWRENRKKWLLEWCSKMNY